MALLLEYLTLTLLAIASSVTSQCPSGCTCIAQQIGCQADAVSQIPNTGDNDVTTLNLENNRLAVSTLSRSDFSHLRNLQELILSNCGIQTIEANTFSDLTELTLLDLSLNNLRSIDPEAFAGLALTYLFLGDNPSITLPPAGFSGTSTEILDLKNCQLTDISVNFLSPLFPNLNKLYINGNQIKQFSRELENTFSELESIRIQENPLICDCQSRWLKQFYDDNTEKMRQSGDGSQTEPRCSEPQTLAGEFFNRLSVTDFLCDKPTLVSEISFTADKSVLKCTSMAHPPPKITWYKPDGSVDETFPTNDEVTQAEIEAPLAAESSVYRCVASNEAGNTSFSVDLAWPQASDNAEVMPCSDTTTGKEVVIDGSIPDDDSQTEEPDVFKRKYFTIVHIVVAVFGTFAGTLVITVLVLHLCVYRKKKSASQYGTTPNSEYSSGGSMKNEVYPPTAAQHMQIRSLQHMPPMQNRPLPNEPCHRAYDENHYMSTQLTDGEDLVCFGQHNAGALISPHSPPTCQCQPSQPMRSHSRHSQIL